MNVPCFFQESFMAPTSRDDKRSKYARERDYIAKHVETMILFDNDTNTVLTERSRNSTAKVDLEDLYTSSRVHGRHYMEDTRVLISANGIELRNEPEELKSEFCK